MARLTPRFRGDVTDDGRLILTSAEAEQRRRWLLTLKGQRVEVTVRKWRSKRSNEQNRYYRGVVIPPIAHALRLPEEEAHQAVAWLFLRRADDPGRPPTRRSTTQLDTQEMEAYLEHVRQWAAEEYGLYIPLPNEQVDDGLPTD